MVDVTAFIADYTSDDRSCIEFLSNGERGPKLRDANASLRDEVYRALRGGQSASDELIRDLYDAESRWSAAAWCVRHEIVAFLASELLRRGGADNVRHYLECIWRGQDCYQSSLCVQISPEQRAAALVEMAELIAASSDQPIVGVLSWSSWLALTPRQTTNLSLQRPRPLRVFSGIIMLAIDCQSLELGCSSAKGSWSTP